MADGTRALEDVTRRVILPFACALVAAMTVAGRGGAQTTGPKLVRLTGTVLDSTQFPIDGAIVELLSLGLTRSDRNGAFRFSGVPAGLVILRVAKIGFQPLMKVVRLTADSTDVDVTIRSQIYQLPAVVVHRDVELTPLSDPTGFYRRRLYSAGGHFISADDIAKWHFVETSQVMHLIPGVTVNRDGVVSVDRGAMTLIGSSCMGTEVFVNGLSSPALSLNEIPISAIQGIEVYSGPATTPASLHGSKTVCGTVAIWTW
jgi:hypothetical protein